MNRLVIVTGGTKGIGKACVERFLEEGCDVITCSRDEKDLLSLHQELKVRFSSSALYYQVADLSDRQSVSDFIAFIHSFKRPIEALINNTGVFIPGQVHNETEGTLEKTIETNVYSAYHLSRGVLPNMMEQKRGHIFNMCSTASIVGYPNGGSYCISKFALYGMSKVLREEMKPHGIKVTAILPGATLTNSWAGTDLPTDRFMDSKDVAEAIWSTFSLSPRTVVEEILIRPQLGDID